LKFRITQLFPRGFRSFPVAASSTREALDVADMMIDRGATDIKIVDANGRRYDLIQLERLFDEEMAQNEFPSLSAGAARVRDDPGSGTTDPH
jgi:hypothetical protein